MDLSQPYYVLFISSQLILVGVALFGAILGISTVFNYSAEDRNFYYPSWKPAVGFYLLHSLEVIYVIFNLSPEALRFVNAMGLLVPINITLLTWDRFFYFQKTKQWIKALAFMPILVLIPLFLNIIKPNIFGPNSEIYLIISVYIALFIDLAAFFIYQYYCHKKMQKEYEMEYSNISDFPKNFAIQMFCVLGIWVFLHLFMFATNDPFIKSYIDIIRSVIGIFITILWMKENRTKKETYVASDAIDKTVPVSAPITNQNDNQLLEALHKLMREEQVYLNPDLRLSDLQSMLATNRTYLSQAINSKPGQTFYSIVQNYRIEYAKSLLSEKKDLKLEDIAEQAGFSSRSFFSRSFKEYVGVSPSDYRRK